MLGTETTTKAKAPIIHLATTMAEKGMGTRDKGPVSGATYKPPSFPRFSLPCRFRTEEAACVVLAACVPAWYNKQLSVRGYEQV